MQSERITARIRCDIIWHLREEGARTGRSMSKQLEQILLDRYSDRILDDTEYVIENAATAAYELDADLPEGE